MEHVIRHGDLDSMEVTHLITVQLVVTLLNVLPFSVSDVSERWCALAVCSSG